MSSSTPRLTDPVCGMSVRLDAAESDGLVLDHHGTLYAFCRQGCLDSFRTDPHRYSDHSPIASAPTSSDAPVIDDGMRLWYESCSCCLSDAYPDVKAALDAERGASGKAEAAPGICAVAEAPSAPPAVEPLAR
jgi:YHS domain-containing protein